MLVRFSALADSEAMVLRCAVDVEQDLEGVARRVYDWIIAIQCTEI